MAINENINTIGNPIVLLFHLYFTCIRYCDHLTHSSKPFEMYLSVKHVYKETISWRVSFVNDKILKPQNKKEEGVCDS